MKFTHAIAVGVCAALISVAGVGCGYPTKEGRRLEQEVDTLKKIVHKLQAEAADSSATAQATLEQSTSGIKQVLGEIRATQKETHNRLKQVEDNLAALTGGAGSANAEEIKSLMQRVGQLEVRIIGGE